MSGLSTRPSRFESVELRNGKAEDSLQVEEQKERRGHNPEQTTAGRAAARRAIFRSELVENRNQRIRELNRDAGARAACRPGEEPPLGELIYCHICDQWLNGNGQYGEHLRGQRHHSHLRSLWLTCGWDLSWICGEGAR